MQLISTYYSISSGPPDEEGPGVPSLHSKRNPRLPVVGCSFWGFMRPHLNPGIYMPAVLSAKLVLVPLWTTVAALGYNTSHTQAHTHARLHAPTYIMNCQWNYGSAGEKLQQGKKPSLNQSPSPVCYTHQLREGRPGCARPLASPGPRDGGSRCDLLSRSEAVWTVAKKCKADYSDQVEGFYTEHGFQNSSKNLSSN